MSAQQAQSPRAESEASSRHLHLHHHHHHHNMSRKNESVAWRAFVKLGGNKVICRICNKQMNYQSGSSTSNMVKHLQAVHKHILADAKPSPQNNPPPAPPAQPAACVKGADEVSTTPLSNEPWMVLQSAPAHLRQRWQDLKLGLQKEMQQHQQAVAWSVIGQPCLGAPAGADLLTDSDASPAYWSGSTSNNNTSHSHGSGGTPTTRDTSVPEAGADWQRRETDQSCEATSYQYRVKTEPIETDEVLEQAPERPESVSSPPLALSPPPRSPSPIVLCASAPDGSSEPPPSDQNDGSPPPKNKKHKSSQTNLQLPPDPSPVECAELELRLNGIRRAQERAEELHHEHLRESRARAEAAQAERDHRLQLIRHAEEIHLQNLEAQRQALEHSRQLHEITLRQAHSKPCE
ncbi:uncharacterized protein LOC117644465 [Thrips palmi]|uniref:Uncharacterized protein LOC117644465 n=1 Tax=Thrips palmi TaxID=161013 RepID=A0A6P8ZM25_THRPL|nr:uncharacterized protein LOC117644465 [Thrips palmi]